MIFVGDDWAEDHHDVYLMDENGQRLVSQRLPEGLTGIRQLHGLIAEHGEEPDQVVIGHCRLVIREGEVGQDRRS